MLLITQPTNPLKSSGIVLTLAVSALILGIIASNLVFADSHDTLQSGSSALVYESALTGYKTLDGNERAAWKESNDTVGEIGGWRSYAKEAYEANQAEANVEAEAESQSENSTQSSSETVTVTAAPVTDTANKPLEASADTSENTEMRTSQKNMQMKSSGRTGSPPMTLTYQSALTEYRSYDDNPPGDWKAANERVGEIGGWRAYAQEAYEASKLEAQTEAKSGNTQ